MWHYLLFTLANICGGRLMSPAFVGEVYWGHMSVTVFLSATCHAIKTR